MQTKFSRCKPKWRKVNLSLRFTILEISLKVALISLKVAFCKWKTGFLSGEVEPEEENSNFPVRTRAKLWLIFLNWKWSEYSWTAKRQCHLFLRLLNAFKYEECNKDERQGSGSKLYYINLWAMCWPSDHPKRPLICWAFEQANIMQTTSTLILPNANPCQTKVKGLYVSGYANLQTLCKPKINTRLFQM